jgi:serine/threonine protein kinase
VSTILRSHPNQLPPHEGLSAQDLRQFFVLTFHTFLCNCSIIHRDIKPDNIGFDVRGDVKIFDFGLAKEFDPNSKDKDGLYNLTAATGSPRYMATEVALGKPYNETCDVYSFCILLWQILKVETPFDGYTMDMIQKKVITAGWRPMSDPKWPVEITAMMRLGWGISIQYRPSMDNICTSLWNEIQSKTNEEVDEIKDASRKSEISLHRGF